MTEQEKIKYAYELMVKNNPDEAVKQLLLKDKMIISKRITITKAIEYIENHFLYHYGSEKRPIVFEDNYIQEIVDILRGKNE